MDTTHPFHTKFSLIQTFNWWGVLTKMDAKTKRCSSSSKAIEKREGKGRRKKKPEFWGHSFTWYFHACKYITKSCGFGSR